MRKLSLRPEDLRIQSFPTSAVPLEMRGTIEAGMNSVGKTCGNPPASLNDPNCLAGRDGPTSPAQCCI
jgi:hypothetical protein